MKKVLIFLCLIFLASPAVLKASNVNWKWAKHGGSIDKDEPVLMATDANNNVYIAGKFKGASMTLDATTILLSIGTSTDGNIYVAKYDSSGNLLWAKNGGGNVTDLDLHDITVDAGGNVYLTGSYWGHEIEFDNVVFTHSSYTGLNFILKFDSAVGAITLSKEMPGMVIPGIATDAGNNIYVAGIFGSDNVNIDGTVLTRVGSYDDIFFVKMNASGSVLWAKRLGDVNNDRAFDIGVDNMGNVYIAGTYTFSTNIEGTILNSNGPSDMFLAKFNPAGTLQWAKTAGGSGSEGFSEIAVDNADNIYVLGESFSPSITFASVPVPVSANGMLAPVLAKYSANGAEQWLKGASVVGSTDYAISTSVSVDKDNNVFVSGSFSGPSVTFDTITINTLPNYLVKYNAAGMPVWGLGYGGAIPGVASNFSCTDRMGSVYIHSNFAVPMTLGTHTLPAPHGSHDVFVAKLEALVPLAAGMLKHKTNTLAIYPNPANDYVMIDGDWKQGEIIVTDAAGRIVYHASVTAPYTLSTTGFVNGNYSVVVRAMDKVVSAIFTVEK